MGVKKDQHKVGAPEKPRGQQTGFAGNPDKNREAKSNTPALRGRRKKESEFFADKSAQQTGSNPSHPRSNTPCRRNRRRDSLQEKAEKPEKP
jgi:hypothetical protein